MRRLCSLVVATCALLGVSLIQNPTPAASQVPSPEQVALAYLQSRPGATAASVANLRHVVTLESIGAKHVRYQETAQGVPVFGAWVTVNLHKTTNAATLAFDRRSGLAPASAGQRAAAGITASRAGTLAQAAAGAPPLRAPATASQVYFPTGNQLELAWQVIVPAATPPGDWLVVVSADSGTILRKQNLRSEDSAQVFDPNPLSPAPAPSPLPTDCDSGANATALSGQRQARTLLGIQGGQDKLKGQYVDLTAPGVTGAYKAAGLADDASRTYNYACNDDRFEEAMVYYHVDATQRKLQSLGFTGASAIYGKPIPAHAHYDNTCNAFYSPYDVALHFGDGGACPDGTKDAAEDADVIVHEYGHALQDAVVPGWGIGPTNASIEQALGMGEGWGDFLASAINGDPCVAEWFAIGQASCGGQRGLRWLQNTKAYPADFLACPSVNGMHEVHCVGEIWGGALWDLVEALGDSPAARDLVLRLVLDAHFYLSPQATFNEAACAIEQADTDLYGGTHVSTIHAKLALRGIVCGAPSDFPYAYLRVQHPRISDIGFAIRVGPNLLAPTCTVTVSSANNLVFAGGGGADAVGYVSLSGTACNLPPTVGAPWWFVVQDLATGQSGSIVDFQILMNGTSKCVASDVPVAIPDATGGGPGAIVGSKIDCTNTGSSNTTRLLTVTMAGTGTGTVTSNPAGIDCGTDCSQAYGGGTVVALTPAPSAGSVFAGWSGDGDCSDSSVTLSSSRACTATFAIARTLTVTKAGTGSGTVTSNPAGISCGVDCMEIYADGIGVTLTGTPAAGSVFVGFTGDADCNDGSLTMNAARSCTATFSLASTLTVTKAGTGSGTVTSLPAGIDCGVDCAEAYANGTVVALTGTPAANSTFAGFSGNADCTDGSLTMSTDRGCTATFALIPRTLTVSKAGTGAGTVMSNPAGIDCAVDCSEAYLHGTVVALTGTAAAGSTFTGFSGDSDCTDGSLTMSADRTCVATFTLIPRSLTVTKAGNGTGTVTSAPGGINCGGDCSEAYGHGTTVTLTATAAAGSSFASFGGDADCTDGSLAMTADRACTATFTLLPAAPTLTGTPPSPGTVGVGYDFSFTVTGNPAPVVSLHSGALPDGLTLSAPGAIAGTATTVGTFTFTVKAANGVGADAISGGLTIIVAVAPPPPPPSGGGGGGGGGGSGGGGGGGGGRGVTVPTAPVSEAGGVTVIIGARETLGPIGGFAGGQVTAAVPFGPSATVIVPSFGLPPGASIDVAVVVDLANLMQQAPPPSGTEVILGLFASAMSVTGTKLSGDFARPLDLEFAFPKDAIPTGVVAGDLLVAFWDGQTWVTVPSTVLTNADGSITVRSNASHFTVFGVLRKGVVTAVRAPEPTVSTTTGALVSGGVPPAGGFGLIVFGGGTSAQLLAASSCPPETAAFWVSDASGNFTTYVPGTQIAVVNEGWNALFPGSIPANTPLIGRCRG